MRCSHLALTLSPASKDLIQGKTSRWHQYLKVSDIYIIMQIKNSELDKALEGKISSQPGGKKGYTLVTANGIKDFISPSRALHD